MKQSRLRAELTKLGKHGMTYGLAQVLRRLLAFLLIPLYTHYLSTTDYGTLQLVGITVEIVGIVITLGIADAIYRFYYDSDDRETRLIVISSACIGLFSISSPVIVTCALFSWKAAGLVLEARNQGIYILVALGTLYFNNMVEVFYTYLRVKERSATYLIFSILKTGVTLSLTIYLIIFLEKGLLGVFLANLISSVLFFLFTIPYLLCQVGLHFSFSITKRMLRYSLPIIPAALATLVLNVSDRYFIKGYLSVAEVGIYTLGYRLGNIIHYFVRVPFMQIWGPRRFGLYREKAPPEMFAKIATYYVALMIFFGLGVSVFVHDIIKIISPSEYWSAATYTPAVSLSYILYGLDQHVGLGILIAKKTEYWSGINFVTAGLNLLLNLILIANYGIWGAVVSTFAAIAFKVIAYHLIGSRFFAIPFEWHRMLGFLIFASLIYLLSRVFRHESLLLALAWDSFLVIMYVPLLWVVGLIRKSEKEAVIEVFRRGYSIMMLKLTSAQQTL